MSSFQGASVNERTWTPFLPGFAGSQDHPAPAASDGHGLGHLQGAFPGQIRLRLRSGRTGGILSRLAQAFAALEGDAAAGHNHGNQIRGHCQRPEGGKPPVQRFPRSALGRRGPALSRKPRTISNRKRRAGAPPDLFVLDRQMAPPREAADAAAGAHRSRNPGRSIGVRAKEPQDPDRESARHAKGHAPYTLGITAHAQIALRDDALIHINTSVDELS